MYWRRFCTVMAKTIDPTICENFVLLPMHLILSFHLFVQIYMDWFQMVFLSVMFYNSVAHWRSIYLFLFVWFSDCRTSEYAAIVICALHRCGRLQAQAMRKKRHRLPGKNGPPDCFWLNLECVTYNLERSKRYVLVEVLKTFFRRCWTHYYK